METVVFDKVVIIKGKLDEDFPIPQDEMGFTDTVKNIKNNLQRKISIADLDREKRMSDFIKIQLAFAIGRLRQSGAFRGVRSADELWTYKYSVGDGTTARGIASICEGKVKAFYTTNVETDK